MSLFERNRADMKTGAGSSQAPSTGHESRLDRARSKISSFFSRNIDKPQESNLEYLERMRIRDAGFKNTLSHGLGPS